MRLPALPIRLLPVTLGVVALVLPLKLVSLWRDAALLPAPSVIAEATAGEASPPAQPEAGAAGAAPQQAAAVAPPGAAAPAAGDPLALTQTEIDLLQKLAARREALDARERELDMREGLLRAAEQQLQAKADAKAAELAAMQAKIEALVKQRDEEQEKKIADLVSVYEKMKPKDAARIFNDLDLDLLVDLLGRMRDAKTAPILASMDETRARAVTARLAERQTRAQPAP
ncbi:MAG: hypothetical protein BroJett029_38770 [Alphaproteobacteria bacterium]|nr:MAG: hypothetical protein BroJett029_38770 [Alphaproteobacteria bacterium]